MSKREKKETPLKEVAEYVVSVEKILAGIKAEIQAAQDRGIESIIFGHEPTRVKATESLISIHGELAKSIMRVVAGKTESPVITKSRPEKTQRDAPRK